MDKQFSKLAEIRENCPEYKIIKNNNNKKDKMMDNRDNVHSYK